MHHSHSPLQSHSHCRPFPCYCSHSLSFRFYSGLSSTTIKALFHCPKIENATAGGKTGCTRWRCKKNGGGEANLATGLAGSPFSCPGPNCEWYLHFTRQGVLGSIPAPGLIDVLKLPEYRTLLLAMCVWRVRSSNLLSRCGKVCSVCFDVLDRQVLQSQVLESNCCWQR